MFPQRVGYKVPGSRWSYCQDVTDGHHPQEGVGGRLHDGPGENQEDDKVDQEVDQDQDWHHGGVDGDVDGGVAQPGRGIYNVTR